MAAMYAVYHGSEGLKEIAARVHSFALLLKDCLKHFGLKVSEAPFFDTVSVSCADGKIDEIIERAWRKKINLRKYDNNTLTISFDETTGLKDVEDIVEVLTTHAGPLPKILSKEILVDKSLR
jgi:glycine dehydrogenase